MASRSATRSGLLRALPSLFGLGLLMVFAAEAPSQAAGVRLVTFDSASGEPIRGLSGEARRRRAVSGGRAAALVPRPAVQPSRDPVGARRRGLRRAVRRRVFDPRAQGDLQRRFPAARSSDAFGALAFLAARARRRPGAHRRRRLLAGRATGRWRRPPRRRRGAWRLGGLAFRAAAAFYPPCANQAGTAARRSRPSLSSATRTR